MKLRKEKTGYNWRNTFNTANERVTTLGFTYDTSGNATDAARSPTFTYNEEIFLTAAGARISYTYDAQVPRVKKTASGVTTDHFYAGSVVIAE